MERVLLSAVLLLGGMLSAGCGGPSASQVAEAEPLPVGAEPFDYDRGHLYFDARLCDSLPARLIFDSGASGLHVDSQWLAHSGLQFRQLGRACLRGAGQRLQEVPLVFDSLSFGVGTRRLESRQTPVFDLKSLLGRRIDGIFGADCLHRFAGACVLFDLRRGYLQAVDPDTLAGAGFRTIPARTQGDFLLVEACVRFDDERVVSGRFLLDTGCGQTLIVNAPAAGKADFAGYAGVKVRYTTVAGGVGGDSECEICRAAEVGFGGNAFASVPVAVSCDGSGYLAREDVAGVIGTKLLERFVFAIDFAAPALWLRPAEACGERFPYETAGFAAIDRTDIGDGWVVTGLYDGIAPAGLRPGDTIVGWDGIPLAGQEQAERLMREPGRHRIEVARGGERANYEIEVKEIL